MKKALIAGLIALSLGSTSCLGPDRAYNSVKNWNAELSDQDWINEVAFLAMNIVPVYGVCLFADILIFNTVNYWTNDNPINDPGAFAGFTKD